jgi:hypothetical protein
MNSTVNYYVFNFVSFGSVVSFIYVYVYPSLMSNQIFPYLLQISVSNATHVTLRNVGFNLSGNFTCEVTADAPSFYTAVATNILTVVGKYLYYMVMAIGFHIPVSI